MPSALASDPKLTERHDDLDNYDVDDFFDDPFASPPPDASSKKRKEPESGLGIDEEVSVQKRARVPNVKLDEERLLGPKGLPKLRARAHNLKIKGKGHEFSDAARLLSFYQLWLDDLFPKAKFLDALTMVEKAGHKKQVMTARNDMIQEGKPKDPANNEQVEEDDTFGEDTGSTRTQETVSQASEVQRPSTPEPRDIPSDEDLYDATPRPSQPIIPIRNEDEPDADDLEALMAEADGQDQSRDPRPIEHETNADDLDALLAEAQNNKQAPTPDASKPTNNGGAMTDEFADEEAAMQEMEGLW
ncbi:replication fork protection component Swi3-domain-containing protein [Thelonectria olida]|uniref:Chromosome segregation in meiosis protein n=1 Tax=Thelonectria olida TaxID=1576542 RepID=A0A9P9AII4_9HYPO|nr:replication fork protection component Swi3-domain-containing protein [Thelonectria olida]